MNDKAVSLIVPRDQTLGLGVVHHLPQLGQERRHVRYVLRADLLKTKDISYVCLPQGGAFQFSEQQKQVRFQQTHNKGLRQLFLTLSSDRYLVPEATHEASRGPLKGAVSAQKALQGSRTETRELLAGTQEKSLSPMRGH